MPVAVFPEGLSFLAAPLAQPSSNSFSVKIARGMVLQKRQFMSFSLGQGVITWKFTWSSMNGMVWPTKSIVSFAPRSSKACWRRVRNYHHQRDLSRQLSVSRNTVAVAYERLVAEGFVIGRVGAGTFVGETFSFCQSGA